MSRQTCQAYELTDDTYVLNNGVIEKIVKAHTVLDRTTIINGNGDSWRISSSANISLATEAEAAEYERERDRRAVADALRSLGDKILSRSLPVPVGGRGIVVSFDLADDSDLEPWSQWLSKRPQRGTSRPHIQAEAEGVEVYVYGPGNSGEFGPDLADARSASDDLADAAMEITMAEVFSYGPVLDPPTGTAGRIEVVAPDVEHRDSVGAFPVVPALPSYDPNPTLLMQPGGRTSSAYASYAKSLDKSNPGWWNDDLSRMAGGLAFEAQSRRNDEDTAGPHGGSGWEFSDGHRPPVDDEAMKHDRHSGEG